MARKRSTSDGTTARDAHYAAELTRLETMFSEMAMTRAELANRSPTSPATAMQLIAVLDYMLELVEIAITPPPVPRAKPAVSRKPKVRRTAARQSRVASKG